ncbi:MAG: extradiol ring-cleavage dioxygenase [Sphingobium limneticum]
MAEIVLGIGTSHTPLLTLEAGDWAHRAETDYTNERLNLSDGRWISYPDLLAEVGPRYAAEAALEVLHEKEKRCQTSLDNLKAEIEAAAPDVMLVIGDDQSELFGKENLPTFSIFYGETVITHDRWTEGPEWVMSMGRGYAMDAVHSFPGAPEFARDLITGLMQRHIDVSTSDRVVDPHRAGFGHAFGFIVERLLGARPIPIVPLLLNTYYPPNVPTAARVHDIGRALRDAINDHPSSLRVAIIASGGLSHFIVDEELDRKVIDGFKAENAVLLRELPPGALNSGSSEILNWIMAAGAVDHLPLKWLDYEPLYRTPAGTGVGAAFGVWASDQENRQC